MCILPETIKNLAIIKLAEVNIPTTQKNYLISKIQFKTNN